MGPAYYPTELSRHTTARLRVARLLQMVSELTLRVSRRVWVS
jgi:hypothetical protein